MNKLLRIKFRQIAAASLLAVFLFVHIVKIFHHHHLAAEFHSIGKAGKASVKELSCSICDYHFVKDANSTILSTALPLSFINSPDFIQHLIQRTSSVGLSSADRGPPAIS